MLLKILNMIRRRDSILDMRARSMMIIDLTTTIRYFRESSMHDLDKKQSMKISRNNMHFFDSDIAIFTQLDNILRIYYLFLNDLFVLIAFIYFNHLLLKR